MMDYTIKFSFAMLGDVVPLAKVAEAMARHRATGGGAIPWNQHAYQEVKPHYENLLLDAANNGRLQVCDQFGTVNAISEIYAADRMAALNPKTAPILTLYAKAHHLNQWAAANGDNFRLEDTGAQDVELTTGILLLESLAEQTTGVTHRKKWTPEKLAELASYRATHTMPDTAEKFHISQSRIRELLPSKKLKASPFPGVIHRAK